MNEGQFHEASPQAGRDADCRTRLIEAAGRHGKEVSMLVGSIQQGEQGAALGRRSFAIPARWTSCAAGSQRRLTGFTPSDRDVWHDTRLTLGKRELTLCT
jgi:hypothetical protein